jgi:hypothetical protein
MTDKTKTKMHHIMPTKLTEADCAVRWYPHLKQQLQTFHFYRKQINEKDTPFHAYVCDLIGITELQIALAQAIIANAKEYHGEERVQKCG